MTEQEWLECPDMPTPKGVSCRKLLSVVLLAIFVAITLVSGCLTNDPGKPPSDEVVPGLPAEAERLFRIMENERLSGKKSLIPQQFLATASLDT